jgi:hypothetical protein
MANGRIERTVAGLEDRIPLDLERGKPAIRANAIATVRCDRWRLKGALGRSGD